MIFHLYHNPSGHFLLILPETRKAESQFRLLSSRDPTQPMEFKMGWTYFNPLLSGKDGYQVFLQTPEGLRGYQTNRPPPRTSKAEALTLARGWFELPRENLTEGDLSTALAQLIYRTPNLVGIIAQQLRTQLGLALPEQINFSTSQEWVDWFRAQQLPLRPALRQFFQGLYVNNNSLIFTPEHRHFLLTGTPPEPVATVKLRWLKVCEVTTVAQKLYESMEWEMSIPETVFKAGEAAILAYAREQFGTNWAVLEKEATGETIKQQSVSETVFDGPLIFYRSENKDNFTLITGNKPTITTVIDQLNEAIERL